MSTVRISAPGHTVTIGPGQPLALIAGPCVIESEELTLEIARRLAAICTELGVPLVFKASFDKANRTSIASFRGPGMEQGLAVLAGVRQEVGLPVLSDIHEPGQAEAAAQVLDCLQIPAFLCRQTDLLVAAARTGKPVNIKKGQFVAPWDMGNATAKVREAGGGQILLTERGTFFGYNNLVVDMRSLCALRQHACPVVFDATHSVQLPGGGGTASGGQRQFVAPLARAAAAVGVDALFLEVHPDPDHALCDGPNSLPLDQVAPLLHSLLAIRRAVNATAGTPTQSTP